VSAARPALPAVSVGVSSNVRPHIQPPSVCHALKTLLVILLLLLVIAVVALLVAKRLGLLGGAAGPWPLYVKRPLSQPEQVLYHRLIRALPEHIVLAQVQVSRVLGVKKGANFHEWNNRINRLSYDFVVCAKDSTVIAAIELDDKSHESASRKKTDEKKNKASADAGLRLLRWQVRSLPSEQAVRDELLPKALAESVPDQAAGKRRSAGVA
jgi:Protein of unknown function (DUF2726)